MRWGLGRVTSRWSGPFASIWPIACRSVRHWWSTIPWASITTPIPPASVWASSAATARGLPKGSARFTFRSEKPFEHRTAQEESRAGLAQAFGRRVSFDSCPGHPVASRRVCVSHQPSGQRKVARHRPGQGESIDSGSADRGATGVHWQPPAPSGSDAERSGRRPGRHHRTPRGKGRPAGAAAPDRGSDFAQDRRPQSAASLRPARDESRQGDRISQSNAGRRSHQGGIESQSLHPESSPL